MDFNYNNYGVENAVNSLKATFFDMFYRHEGSVNHLKEQMDKFNEVDKATAAELIAAQSRRLERSMNLVNEIISLVQKIDVDSKRIENLYFGLETSMDDKENTNTADVVIPVSDVPVNESVVDTNVALTSVADDIVADGERGLGIDEEIESAMSVEMDTAPSEEIAKELAMEASTEAVVSEEVNVDNQVTVEDTVSVNEENISAETVNMDNPVTDESTSIEGTVVVDNQVEDGKEYIADTPEQVNLDMFNMFKELPGMENIKLDENGNPDFSQILPQEVMDRVVKSGDMSLSGIAKAVAQDNREKNGIIEPVLPVIESDDTVVNDSENTAGDVNASENQEVNSEVTTEIAQEVVPEVTSEVAMEEQVVIPTVAPPASPADVVVNQNEITNEISAAMDEVVVSENSSEAVIDNNTLVTADSTGILPFENVSEQDVVIPAENVDVQTTPVEAVDTTIPVQEEVVTDVETEVVAENENGLRRFIEGESQPKAILVSEVQYNKLANSKVTQEALLKFKQVLPEINAPVAEVATEVEQTSNLVNMSDDEKSKTIEAMMADANQLYNSGRIEEAQAMYEKISEINKTLVKS